MTRIAAEFWKGDCGQDLTEHALLLAMIALASCALFLGSGASISGVWNSADSRISVAYKAASS